MWQTEEPARVTEEFGASHQGCAGAVLPDGIEPKPAIFDLGSGTATTVSANRP